MLPFHCCHLTAGQETDGRILVTERKALLPNKRRRSHLTDTAVYVGFISPGTSHGDSDVSLNCRNGPSFGDTPPAALLLKKDSFENAQQLARQS